MQMLGHDGPPAGFWRENLITDTPLSRCPVRTLQLARAEAPALAREIDRYADVLYPKYKKGHTLVDGGVATQPARYLEIVTLFENMESAVEAKALELARVDEDE